MVVQIVLKQEKHFLVCSKLGQRCIPRPGLSQPLFIGTQRTVGQKLRTKLAHLPKRKTCRRGTFMEDIFPGDNSPWQTCVPERSPDTVAVGNMQHRSSLSVKHEPPRRVNEHFVLSQSRYEHRHTFLDGSGDQFLMCVFPQVALPFRS